MPDATHFLTLNSPGFNLGRTEGRAIATLFHLPYVQPFIGHPAHQGVGLVGDGEVEGDWFHSGRGAAETSHDPPREAVGVRLRFWPSEGLDPEYIDLPLPDSGLIETISLDYDHPGPHSRLDLSQL